MRCPLIIGGRETFRDDFRGSSLFYPGYSYSIANAGALDIAHVIGSARNAGQISLETRTACLQKAAAAFSYSDEDCEHAVRMLGMPISIIKEHFDSIPAILDSLPQSLNSRFTRFGGKASFNAERLDAGFYKLLAPQEGFCYAVTPGNDVRVVAMVAANLCYAGVPFVIKASKEDAAAPLVIRALLEGGISPDFCNLVYFDSAAPDAAKKHFKIMAAARTFWTFGLDETVDVTLRFELKGNRRYLDVTDLMADNDDGIDILKSKLAGNSFDARARLVVKDEVVDHFVVDSPNWVADAADYLASLVVGDPLDPKTQVGYTNSANLNYLQRAVEGRRGVEVLGGERLSPIQARPLVARCQEVIPELFGQEIPAYVLAARDCATVDEAVSAINGTSGKNPRLSVSIMNVAEEDWRPSIFKLKTHAVFIDAPTTTIVPYYHEGNDYTLRLSRERLVNGNWLMEWAFI